MIDRKRLQQELLVRERVQKNIVVRVEVADELRDRRARLRNLGFHAARGIDQDPDRHRRIDVAAQELERALDPVDVDAEVALLQAGDVTAALIGHRDGQLLVAALAAQRARGKFQFRTLLRRELRHRGRVLAALARRRRRHFEHRFALMPWIVEGGAANPPCCAAAGDAPASRMARQIAAITVGQISPYRLPPLSIASLPGAVPAAAEPARARCQPARLPSITFSQRPL